MSTINADFMTTLYAANSSQLGKTLQFCSQISPVVDIPRGYCLNSEMYNDWKSIDFMRL